MEETVEKGMTSPATSFFGIARSPQHVAMATTTVAVVLLLLVGSGCLLPAGGGGSSWGFSACCGGTPPGDMVAGRKAGSAWGTSESNYAESRRRFMGDRRVGRSPPSPTRNGLIRRGEDAPPPPQVADPSEGWCHPEEGPGGCSTPRPPPPPPPPSPLPLFPSTAPPPLPTTPPPPPLPSSPPSPPSPTPPPA